MKKLYTLVLLSVVGTASFAQNRIANLSNQPLDYSIPVTNTSNFSLPPTDTLWLNLAAWTGAFCNPSTGGGYVCGNNGYGDMQKVQGFVSTGPTTIYGAIYWFAAKKVLTGGPNSVVKFQIYAMDGTGTTSSGSGPCPGTIMKTQNVQVGLVDTSSSLVTAFVHYWTTTTTTSADFGVGFDVTALAAGDTVGCVFSGEGDALVMDQSWDQFNDASWHSWLDAGNWGFNRDMAIFPIVDFTNSITENFVNGVNISTYPNPAVDNATISYGLQNDVNNVEIMILDATGKVVSVIPQGKQTVGTHTVNVDTKSLAAGTYLVTISAGHGHIATKLVIQ